MCGTSRRASCWHRYILGGESIALSEVLRLMSDVSGRRPLHIPVPARLAEIAAATLELVADHVTRRPPTGTREGVRIALRARSLSIEKAQRELGYAPRPVEPILRETIAQLLAPVACARDFATASAAAYPAMSSDSSV
jgi:dihydroflavonol-4-reductase